MSKRPNGWGSIEAYRGRWRARLSDERRTTLGVRETREEAEKLLDAHFAVSDLPSGGESLASYGPRWLDRRELAGYRGIDQERSRWATYVEPWECFRWPMREIRRGDVRRWADGLARRLADATVRNALQSVRGCLAAALDDEIIDTNVATGVKVHRRGSTKSTWGYLTVDEQRALLTCADVPTPTRLLIALALGTGLRWGEQRVLRLEDVHLEGPTPHVYVRASRDGAPKSTKHRRVPLFGVGAIAARALVGHARGMPPTRNPRGLLCVPPRSDHYRDPNGPRLDVSLEAAGIKRHLRWHDLRHTCASSLISGVWGRRWSLEEVRDLLGHSSVTVTERYAHLAGTAIEAAAGETSGGDLGCPTVARTESRKYLSHLRDLNSRPTVYEGGHETSGVGGMGHQLGETWATSPAAAILAPVVRSFEAARVRFEADGRVVRAFADVLDEARGTAEPGELAARLARCGALVGLDVPAAEVARKRARRR